MGTSLFVARQQCALLAVAPQPAHVRRVPRTTKMDDIFSDVLLVWSSLLSRAAHRLRALASGEDSLAQSVWSGLGELAPGWDKTEHLHHRWAPVPGGGIGHLHEER